MAKVKIISDPYEKYISFQSWDDNLGEWIPIDSSTCGNSKLLSQELSTGFFPFKMKEIVDYIIEEYHTDGEPLEILFQGTEDEYEELLRLCEDRSDVLVLKRAEEYLKNARDILPDVIELFQQMHDSVIQCVSGDKVQRDLERFSDASSNVVPICVLGNYSAGKSTFINALIGSEVLPSGDQPVTAKIYKISRAQNDGQASISFSCEGCDYQINFTKTDEWIQSGNTNQILYQTLSDRLSGITGQELTLRVSEVLSQLNDFDDEISDLIRLEVPFHSGVLADTEYPFVIIDTPGSNTVSNEQHLAVLKEELGNMTNGMPIYVCEYSALDSADNEKLYNEIMAMDEIDRRFAMIVINKADSANLPAGGFPERKRQQILEQAVPRNLYSGGIFFVSSIVGLGSKNNGVFQDDHYDDVYGNQSIKYTQPSHKHYNPLYRFNMMPEQLQVQRLADAESFAHQNLLYANSGLYSIEREIETFAAKYSAYNKCVQSKKYLDSVIETIHSDLQHRREQHKQQKADIEQRLDEEKTALRNCIIEESEKQYSVFHATHENAVSKAVGKVEKGYSDEEIKRCYTEYKKTQNEVQCLDLHEENERAAWGQIGNHFAQNLRSIPSRKVNGIRTVGQNFVQDVSQAAYARKSRIEIFEEAKRAAAEQTIESVNNDFNSRRRYICRIAENTSLKFWFEKTKSLKQDLIHIVTDTEALTDEQRKELSEIILHYEEIGFQERGVLSDVDQLKWKIQIGKRVLLQTDFLDFKGVAKTYKDELELFAQDYTSSLVQSHWETAVKWKAELLHIIIENLVRYSPELSRYHQQIQDTEEQINEIEGNLTQLEEYDRQLQSMMSWQS